MTDLRTFKKIEKKYSEHEKIAMHTEAVLMLAAIQIKSCGIGAKLSTQLLPDQRHQWEMLMQLLGNIKYLA